MIRSYIAAYPWDVLDEGIDAVLDQCQGALGVTGLSLSVSCPAALGLRRRVSTSRIFRTRGGLFFHPDEEHFAGTRCKPLTSGWLKSKDPLTKTKEACDARGLELRCVVSASRTGRLAARHPEMACKNVFGDPSHEAICLCNPDVEAYLCALLGDLGAHHAPAAIVLTDFCIAWSEANAPELVAPSLTDAGKSLLATCFCESCHQLADQADVDVASAKRSVEVILRKSFDSHQADERSLESLLADDPPLEDYSRWRGALLCDLLARMEGVCPCDVVVQSSLLPGQREQYDALRDSSATIADPVLRLAEELLNPQGEGLRELVLPVEVVNGADSAALVRAFAQAAEGGYAAIGVEHYGQLSDEAFTAIRQAVRFARRSG